MLRDRLVCGVNNEQLQRRLLSEPQLTFKKGLEISQTFETAAARDAKDLQDRPRSMAPVHNITQKTGQLPCYCCGGQHNSLACRHRESSCHNCGRKGHLAKKCLNSQQVHAQLPQKPPPHTQQPLFKNTQSPTTI